MTERARWACPDLGLAKEPGKFLGIPGSKSEFAECPAAYLRTASDVVELRIRRGGEPFAEHLVDGATHLVSIISEVVSDLKNGARTYDSLSAKTRDLVTIYVSEENDRDAHDAEMREEERSARG